MKNPLLFLVIMSLGLILYIVGMVIGFDTGLNSNCSISVQETSAQVIDGE